MTNFKILPMAVGMSLELAYPSRTITTHRPLAHRLDLNHFVDSVLRTIYHISASVGGVSTRRRIVFTAFSPDVCSALNWKQPNCKSSCTFLEIIAFMTVQILCFSPRNAERRAITPTAVLHWVLKTRMTGDFSALVLLSSSQGQITF
jgi:hypothetical protein